MEMVVYVNRMRMRCKHVDDVSLHTYIHTYIHKYSDFLVAMISVGLAQARPNYLLYQVLHIIINMRSQTSLICMESYLESLDTHYYYIICTKTCKNAFQMQH